MPVPRKATLDDIPELERLIALSARALCGDFYTQEQVEAALGSAWGVDRQLIRDGTYFVVEEGDGVAGCGGWSKRKALFGSDTLTRSEPALLDPRFEPARIRAFFIHPGWARRGIGRMLLQHCENEARVAGFSGAELVATLPGEKLYAACGYRRIANLEHVLRDGLTISFVRMERAFDQ